MPNAGSSQEVEGLRAAMDVFERYTDQDVLDQIGEFPLAWLCPRAEQGLSATLLPLLAEPDASGKLASLLGHMARRNPLYELLTRSPDVLILFNGPHGYVSPACVSDPNWGPTWNYAQVRVEATIAFNASETDAALHQLLSAMEVHEPTGWTTDKLGARYRPMSQAVIAFRATVTGIKAKFKLGQDENVERLREILERHRDPTLVRWMKRFNASRIR